MEKWAVFLLCFTIAYLLQTVWVLKADIKDLKNEVNNLKGLKE